MKQVSQFGFPADSTVFLVTVQFLTVSCFVFYFCMPSRQLYVFQLDIDTVLLLQKMENYILGVKEILVDQVIETTASEVTM